MAAAFLTLTPPAMAQDAPRSGQTFGDWLFNCTAISETASRCQLKQTMITGGETRRAVAQLMLAPLPENRVALTAVVPLGLSIPAGVRAVVDGGDEIPLRLERCIQAGCIAGQVLSADQLTALRAGTVLAVRFDAVGGRTITLDGSLTGISAGLDATGWGG